MFGGGGGLNPRKMKQMMNQMGIDLEDIDAEEVIIRTPEEELVFHDAEVQRMDAGPTDLPGRRRPRHPAPRRGGQHRGAGHR